MKILLTLISIIFFFSCDITAPEDCAGVARGCNICDCDDETALNFMGVFNVEFSFGMGGTSGECVADTFDYGGPSMAQLTLGATDENGAPQLQYFEQHLDEFSMRPEWEFHVASAQTETECGDFAEENGCDYHYCDNWGHDYQNWEESRPVAFRMD